MNIFTTLQIGHFHTHHCEDFLVVADVLPSAKLIAVMDGSTMGTESVFASMLTGKLLRKIAKEVFYQGINGSYTSSSAIVLHEVLQRLFVALKQAKNDLGLSTPELLNTLIIGVVEMQSMSSELLAIGDGLVCVDGVIHEYDHDNKPDYVGYHLGEPFEHWFDSQHQRISVPKFSDLSICTDGIFSFMNLKNKSLQKSEQEIISYLLKDAQGEEHPNFLEKKIRFLADEWNHIPTDDLAIVRLRV